MMQVREVDPLLGELFLAGEVVPPGEYCEINDGRTVRLTSADILPASLNGHVACYRRNTSWISTPADHQRRAEAI